MSMWWVGGLCIVANATGVLWVFYSLGRFNQIDSVSEFIDTTRTNKQTCLYIVDYSIYNVLSSSNVSIDLLYIIHNTWENGMLNIWSKRAKNDKQQ